MGIFILFRILHRRNHEKLVALADMRSSEVEATGGALVADSAAVEPMLSYFVQVTDFDGRAGRSRAGSRGSYLTEAWMVLLQRMSRLGEQPSPQQLLSNKRDCTLLLGHDHVWKDSDWTELESNWILIPHNLLWSLLSFGPAGS